MIFLLVIILHFNLANKIKSGCGKSKENNSSLYVTLFIFLFYFRKFQIFPIESNFRVKEKKNPSKAPLPPSPSLLPKNHKRENKNCICCLVITRAHYNTHNYKYFRCCVILYPLQVEEVLLTCMLEIQNKIHFNFSPYRKLIWFDILRKQLYE